MHGPGRLPIAGAILFWCAGFAVAATPLPKGQVSRSDLCAECHKDIYKMWRSSAHSRSMEDPIFLDAYRETDERQGEEVSKICLKCHAPAAGILKDPKLALKVTWEGVSCDICHVMSAVQVNPGRTSGTSSSSTTTTLKFVACAVALPVPVPVAWIGLLPISVTCPLNVRSGMASIEIVAFCPN